jgi:hypothetical protein
MSHSTGIFAYHFNSLNYLTILVRKKKGVNFILLDPQQEARHKTTTFSYISWHKRMFFKKSAKIKGSMDLDETHIRCKEHA